MRGSLKDEVVNRRPSSVSPVAAWEQVWELSGVSPQREAGPREAERGEMWF